MFVEELEETKVTPQIGEIWSVNVPEFYLDDDHSIVVKIQKRPLIVLDDGRGLVVEENDDYHCYKITTKKHKPYREIKNWKEKGLKRKSYYRIEMPIKIELHQFNYKIGELDAEEMRVVYRDILSYFNIETLQKIANEENKN